MEQLSFKKLMGEASLAPTPDAPLGFRKCRRCDSTGIYSEYVRRHHMGAPGVCLACDGEGRVRISTPEEIAAKKAQKAADEYKYEALNRINMAVASNDDIRVTVMCGHKRLMDKAPERFAKMLASVHAGRLDAVIAALVAYETEERRIENANDPVLAAREARVKAAQEERARLRAAS